jgi:hypothetical protein
MSAEAPSDIVADAKISPGEEYEEIREQVRKCKLFVCKEHEFSPLTVEP